MCDFASFLVTNTGEILVYDMFSHSNTVEHYKLKPETYREAEWLYNDPESLIIRTLDTDSIVFKKAKESIINLYPTRQDFLNKYMTETVQLEAVKEYGYAIKYIKNPSEAVQLEAVKQNGCAIRYIKNPSKEVQLKAIKENGNAIRYIKKPTEKMKLIAVKQNGYAIIYINNPSEKVQLAAVKQNGIAIKYINNPSEAVINYVSRCKN